MLNKLMGNLGPMKEVMDNTKKKLGAISVKGEAERGLVIVYANGNRRITEININQKLMDDGDKEAIEELVQIAINKALEHADSVNEMEMASAARNMIPGMF
ncbi:MAG: YbaB/EbfC family nucleoid-associated protein [Bacteroidetes bacterium]|nr:MAG: YbaB/EbfC family nucleoid-associated protein [Bacteroidota bacterium]